MWIDTHNEKLEVGALVSHDDKLSIQAPSKRETGQPKKEKLNIVFYPAQTKQITVDQKTSIKY